MDVDGAGGQAGTACSAGGSDVDTDTDSDSRQKRLQYGMCILRCRLQEITGYQQPVLSGVLALLSTTTIKLHMNERLYLPLKIKKTRVDCGGITH